MFARLRPAAACAVFSVTSFIAIPAASAGDPLPPKIPPPKIDLPKLPKGPMDLTILPPKLNHYHVDYRMPLPRTKTFLNHAQAHQFENKLKSLGFQTNFVHHGAHYHVRYELDVWRQKIFFGAAGHAQAHALENWLKSIGAQTKLVHH
jgi:hypothetical protein